MKTSISYLAILATILFQLSCSRNAQDSMITLDIIATTDVHGALFPYDFINNRPAPASLAQVHAYADSLRRQKQSEIILLDNGDILQGQPVVYYSNFEDTATTHICARVMNYMGYDAASVGNHDIEAGHPVYDKLRQEMNFPWLAANAVDAATGEPYFTPYTIVERGGLRIAILGMITPAIPKWLPENIWEGIAFQDMIAAARQWVPHIQQQEQPDLLIGLFHAGLDYTFDGEDEDTPKNENASKLVAQQVPGFDLIIAGHDHQPYEGWVAGPENDSVLIINPGGYARQFGHVRLQWQADKDGPKTYWQSHLVATKTLPESKLFINQFEEEVSQVTAYVNDSIGQLQQPLNSREAFWGPSAFVDLIHQVQLDLTGADISFTASLAYDTQLNKGPLYVRDMFKLYRYENLLYTMQLSGQEIQDALEFSAGLWFNTMQSPDDHLLHYQDAGDNPQKPRLAHAYYNFESAAGIHYTVDVSQPQGQRITISQMANGRPFYPDSVYQVAVNSYRGSGGGGHLTQGSGIAQQALADRIITATDKDLRYYLMQWIRTHSPLQVEPLNHWQVVPKPWVQQGKTRDYPLLFRQN